MRADWIVVFRRLPEACWQVEFHDPFYLSHVPSGLAWVADCPPAPPALLYVLVADPCRRQGVATALLQACRERWPGLLLPPADSEAGAALLCSLSPVGEK